MVGINTFLRPLKEIDKNDTARMKEWLNLNDFLKINVLWYPTNYRTLQLYYVRRIEEKARQPFIDTVRANKEMHNKEDWSHKQGETSVRTMITWFFLGCNQCEYYIVK